MGSDGSRGPRPYPQVTLSTCFVRVPALDWPAVKHGYKREFRGSPGRSSALWNIETPTPCVAYAITHRGHESALMVLEGVRREMLGAIGPESLVAEGFESFAEFRAYWISRERKRFQPTRHVAVYGIRPWTPDDRSQMGEAILRRLYGQWTDEADADRAG